MRSIHGVNFSICNSNIVSNVALESFSHISLLQLIFGGDSTELLSIKVSV